MGGNNMKQIQKRGHSTGKRILAIGMLLNMLLVAGCGNIGMDDAKNMYVSDGEYYDGMEGSLIYSGMDSILQNEMDSAMDYEMAAEEVSGDTMPASIPDSARKLIKNVQMSLETKEFDAFWTNLESRIAQFGGYVESSQVRGTSRWADVTIRIPAESLDDFCNGVSQIANVTMRSETSRDVTLAYYDLESHVKALRVEYDTLIDILGKCKDMEDVINVQSRITEVLYQIESFQTQLKNYDNLVSYSTVSLSIFEVEKETVLEKQTMGDRILAGLTDTMHQIAEDAQNLTVCLIVSLPYILLWAIVIFVVVLVIRGMWKRHKKKKSMRQQTPSQPPMMPKP